MTPSALAEVRSTKSRAITDIVLAFMREVEPEHPQLILPKNEQAGLLILPKNEQAALLILPKNEQAGLLILPPS
ncbi:MAG: hypothetical protein ACPGWR_02210 [Ardenticatenaceae bacterium]